MSSGRAEKFLGGRANHYGTSIAGEQEQAIFQPGHHGIHVLAQSAEDFVDAAKLLPDLRNFAPHLAEFVAAAGKSKSARLRYGRIVLAGGNTIELRGNVAQRRQRGTADDCGYNR